MHCSFLDRDVPSWEEETGDIHPLCTLKQNIRQRGLENIGHWDDAYGEKVW